MTLAEPIAQFNCPRCSIPLATPVQGMNACPACSWKGEVFLFRRIAREASGAELAMPDDATCIHHPRKKASAVCAGTGDYICSLCTVELNDQTYSASYLETVGKDKISGAFDRFLPRPDSQIALYLICIFVPYANFIFIPFAFLWIPHAFFLYSKALKMRRENPLFRRLMGPVAVVTYPILLTLAALFWVGLVVVLLFAISSTRR